VASEVQARVVLAAAAAESSPPVDERWAAVQQVATSVAFQKAHRLRDLLLYLADRTLRHPDVPIREHEIGVDVFGRTPGFDTSQDTLVRVQASQLRKKLQQYFLDHPDEDTVPFDLPKGSYSLVFHPKDSVSRMSDSAADDVSPGGTRSIPKWVAWGTAALLGVACILLFIQNRELKTNAEFGLGPLPTANRLWQQMFGNGRSTYLVLADTNLLFLEDAIQHQLTAQEYQSKNFPRLAERIEDPEKRRLILNLLGRSSTTVSDAVLARRMGLMFAANRLPLDLISARELAVSHVTSSNTILMGSRRANPWISLYEDLLNFQTVFTEAPLNASFINRQPQPGEQSEYRGAWSKRAYCRVAFLPNTKGTGNVLLISGTDVGSTEAGGDFITSEASVVALRKALQVGPNQPMPYFEVLLEADLVNHSVSQSRMIASRRK
jgi:hypothetical protein